MDVISDRDVANHGREPSPSQSDQAHEQRPAWVIPGLPTLIGALAAMAIGIALTVVAGSSHDGVLEAVGIVVIVIAGVSFGGLFVVAPNEARVLVLFGRYTGSVTEAGWWWCNPFTKRQRISLRVRN